MAALLTIGKSGFSDGRSSYSWASIACGSSCRLGLACVRIRVSEQAGIEWYHASFGRPVLSCLTCKLRLVVWHACNSAPDRSIGL